MWNSAFDTMTYIYAFAIDPQKPPPYIAVWLDDRDLEIEEGYAAVIFGRAPKGIVMGEEYYIGYLDPSTISSFIRLALEPGTTGITLYINARPKSEVYRIAENYRKCPAKQSPFFQVEGVQENRTQKAKPFGKGV
jgi:hypothetical protein